MPKVTAAVQAEIKKAVEALPGDDKPSFKAVSDAYRNGAESVAVAIKQASTKTEVVVTATDDTPSPAQVVTNTKAKVAKSLPQAPEGWGPTYSNTGFVRYARRLKSTSAPVTAYRTAAAKTKDELALVKSWEDGGLVLDTFVVINHITGQAASFNSWAPAYAYSCTMNSPALARSVVSSIGGTKSLPALSAIAGVEVTARPVPEQVEENEEVSA